MRGRDYLSVLVVSLIFWKSARCQLHDSNVDKITRGRAVVDIRSTPHATSLQIQNPLSRKWQKLCGGSIFSPLYVITACHCVTHVDPKSGLMIPLVEHIPPQFWRVVAGTVHLGNFDNSSQTRTPLWIQYHPRCERRSGNESWLVFDLAVAKMAEPFSINEYVKPVKIFSLDHEESEMHLDELIQKRRQPPNLQTEDENQLKIVRLSPMYEGECLVKLALAFASVFGIVNLQTVEYYGKLLHHQICASSIFSDESVCTGDSGSGLLCEGYLVGVTSWGLGCGTQVPDVFQAMPVVVDWFKNQVCSVQTCTDVQNLPLQCIRTELDKRVLRNYLDKCDNLGRVQVGRTAHPNRTKSAAEGVRNKPDEGGGVKIPDPKNSSSRIKLHHQSIKILWLHLTLQRFFFE